MKKNKIFLVSLAMSLLAFNAFGQVKGNVSSPTSQGESIYDPPRQIRNSEYERRERNKKNGIDEKGMIIQTKPEAVVVPVSNKEREEKAEEARRNYEITLKRLQAPAVYYKKYESFLKNEKTGLARLFVDRNCGEGKTVSVEELERCGDFIPVKGGGSYYSFRARANTAYTRDWWDLHFTDNKFKVGSGAVQTIIAEVGGVDLEAVELDSKAVKFLNNYKPKDTLKAVKEQEAVLDKGIKSNDFTYSNLVSANLDSTYVLRSIAYKLKDEPSFYNWDKGVDITVAFRVVGREKDGSLILLWKELKRNSLRRQLK